VFGSRSGETLLAVAQAGGVQTHEVHYGGRDDYTIVRIGNQALRTLWDLTA
jgi:hypothetical protein